MAGYDSRQSTITDGNVGYSSLWNDEYNQILSAFAASTGHKHDGSDGEGGYVSLVSDVDKHNYVEADAATNQIDFYIEVSAAAAAQMSLLDGQLLPAVDNDIDLGSSTYRFKDLYSAGQVDIQNGNIGLQVGGDSGNTAVTDALVKTGWITTPHYSSDTEEQFTLIMGVGDSNNTVNIGGGGDGSNTRNAATAINFYTAATNTTLTGTARVTIDSSGNVGIGTSSPDGKLHVYVASSGASAPSTADDLIVEHAGDGGISILTNAAVTGNITFCDSGGTSGRITYDHSTDDLILYTAGSEVVRVDSSGQVGIGTTSPDELLHVSGGDILLDNAQRLQWKDSGGTARNTIQITASDRLDIGNSNFTDIVLSVGTLGEAVRIKETTGNVGIGVTSPSYPLHVSQGNQTQAVFNSGTADSVASFISTDAGSYIYFEDGSTTTSTTVGLGANSDNLVLYGDGVGIGTNSPDHLLLVNDTNTDALLTDTDALFDETSSQFRVYNDDNGGLWSGISLRTRSSGAATWVISNEWQSSYKGDLVFRGRDGGSSSAEIMRMTFDGNVGIGESSPLGTLHVKTADAGTIGTFTDQNQIILESNDNAGLMMFCPDTKYSSVLFGTPTDTGGALVRWDYPNLTMTVGTASPGGMTVFKYDNYSTGATLDSDGGLYMAGATGSSQGSGTINATGLYADGDLIKDSSFRVYLNTSQTISISTSTAIQFDTADSDVGTGDYSTSTYKFTPTIAGKYYLHSHLLLENLGSGSTVYVYISKNGTFTASHKIYTDASTQAHANISCIVDANGSTDYFEIEVFSSSEEFSVYGSPSATVFEGFRVGA